ISFGTFSYNRGAFVFPLIAVASVTLVQRDKASWRMMFITGVLVFALAPLYALYRTSTVLGGDLLERSDLQDLVLENSDFSGMAQMYGSAPQYLGYLLEA